VNKLEISYPIPHHLNPHSPTPTRVNHTRQFARQTQQHRTAGGEQSKPDHNRVRQALHERVRNTNSHITPSGRDGLLIPDSEVGEGEDGADEVGGLLVQVVEVLGGPLDVGRQHLLHAGLREGRVHVDFVLREGGQALGVHPALHDEGPEVESYLWIC
jgi:hypothetical protein